MENSRIQRGPLSHVFFWLVKLSRQGIVVVFIAAEEGGEKNIGVDKVLEKGKLEEAGTKMPDFFE